MYYLLNGNEGNNQMNLIKNITYKYNLQNN